MNKRIALAGLTGLFLALLVFLMIASPGIADAPTPAAAELKARWWQEATPGDAPPAWPADAGATEIAISADLFAGLGDYTIAFQCNYNNNWEICALNNAEGATVRRLTSDGSADTEPALVPGAHRVVFVSGRHANNGARYELYSVGTIDGADERRLTTGAPGSVGNVQPAVSPDGTQIAFASAIGSHWQIVVSDMGGGNDKQLTSNNAQNLAPAWSPDGRQIAWIARRPDRDGLCDEQRRQRRARHHAGLALRAAIDAHKALCYAVPPANSR